MAASTVDLQEYLSDGRYQVACCFRRPAGDTVVMLRAQTPKLAGTYSSIWLSVRDPEALALVPGTGDVPIVAEERTRPEAFEPTRRPRLAWLRTVLSSLM
jgi:hypothetical protein